MSREDTFAKQCHNRRLLPIAGSFYTDSGAPAYNSGGFVDTLAYAASSAVYRSDLDTTCRMRLVFDRKGCRIETRSEQQAACGFGHGVRPSGYYRKTSSQKPVIKGYWE